MSHRATNSAITLHAHASSADPTVVIVTATDYIVDGAHFDTVDQTLDALTPAQND